MGGGGGGGGGVGGGRGGGEGGVKGHLVTLPTLVLSVPVALQDP